MTMLKELVTSPSHHCYMHLSIRISPVSTVDSSVFNTVASCFCAEESDVRLADEEGVANWKTGRLQVFLEGSWSQVCTASFDDVDANVACCHLAQLRVTHCRA